MTAPPTPYRSTPVFDENSLPAGLRREHRTKAGVWGIIRVFEGRVRYEIFDPPSEVILEPDRPGLILPDVAHFVEPLGPIRMHVEFYDREPDRLTPAARDQEERKASPFSTVPRL